MENKTVGWIITGIAVLMTVIVWIFNNALKRIVGDTCTHGDSCSMYDTIAIQTWVSLAIVGVVLVIGVVLMFIKPKEKIIVKTIKEKKKKKDYSGLERKEKEVVDLLLNEGNAMF